MQKYQTFINGKWVDAAGGQVFETVNPYTTLPWALIPRCGSMDVDAAVRAARMAFEKGEWADMPVSRRGALLRRLGDLITEKAEHLATIETTDNGRLLTEARQQVTHLPQWFHYYAGMADKMDGSVPQLNKRDLLAFTRYEPLGVIAAFTPWNSPLLLLAWKAAPALAAGNTLVIKPSEFTCASTLEFAKLCDEAGFPPGVINVVTGLGSDVGTPLVTHPLVRAVAFTGSDSTGRLINEQAAKTFKRVVLELGGKSPNIVFADADMDAAVNGAVAGIFAASGQACIAGSRLLLEDSIYDKFMDKLLTLARTARLGDPMSPDTQIGPVTTRPQYDKVLGYIDIAKQEGAKLLLGGGASTRPECGKGWFVEPTIFTDVHNKMRIAQEEVFGPVLSVIRFKDEAQALAIANDVRFGLACGIWTRDMGRAFRMSEGIKAGTVWVNSYRVVSPLSPFGGYKDSGLGRANGADAVREYLQVKSVWINTGAAAGNPFVLR